jgi:hypothetical protein
MKDVFITFALVYMSFSAYRYWHKIFSVTTLVTVLFVTVTLDLFDWL